MKQPKAHTRVLLPAAFYFGGAILVAVGIGLLLGTGAALIAFGAACIFEAVHP